MLKSYGSLWSSPCVLVLWASLHPRWPLVSLSLPVLSALTGFCFHELWPAAPLCGLRSESLLCPYPARICFWLLLPSLQTSDWLEFIRVVQVVFSHLAGEPSCWGGKCPSLVSPITSQLPILPDHDLELFRKGPRAAGFLSVLFAFVFNSIRNPTNCFLLGIKRKWTWRDP